MTFDYYAYCVGRYRVDPVRDLSAQFGQSFRLR